MYPSPWRQNVREQGEPAVAQLAGDQGAEQRAIGPEPGTELVTAAKANREHELLAAGERDVERPEGLPLLVDDGGQAGQDAFVGSGVTDPSDGAAEAEAELAQIGVLDTRARTTPARLHCVKRSRR
jgi:hypothetical protein